MTEIEPISDETMEKIVAISPFRFAAKITLQNACALLEIWIIRVGTESPRECAYFSMDLALLFDRYPHYFLRTLDLTSKHLLCRVKSRQPDYDDGGFSIVSCAEKLPASVLNHSG